MKILAQLSPLVLSAALLLAGCGGSSSSNNGGGSSNFGTANLVFSEPSADLSASTGTLGKLTDSSFSRSGNSISGSITAGMPLARNVAFSLGGPAAPAVGATYAVRDAAIIPGESSARLTYSETGRAAGDEFVGTDGTIEVTNFTADAIEVKLTGVTMTAAAGGSARGTFKLNGTYFIRRIQVSVGSGAVDLAFTVNSSNFGSNGLKFNAGGTNQLQIVGTNASIQLTGTQVTGVSQSGATTNNLIFQLFGSNGDIVEGQEFDTSADATNVVLTKLAVQTSGGFSSSSWSSTTGKIRVEKLSGGDVVIRFLNVRMEAVVGGGDQSTGNFVVNGTFAGKLTTP